MMRIYHKATKNTKAVKEKVHIKPQRKIGLSIYFSITKHQKRGGVRTG